MSAESDHLVFLPDVRPILTADFVPFLPGGKMKIKYGKLIYVAKRMQKLDPTFTMAELVGKYVTIHCKKRVNYGSSISIIAQDIEFC
jgi:hypothetical protein